MASQARSLSNNIKFAIVITGTVLGSIGAAWAFAVTAADHVMSPHLESARRRVHLMCVWARIQDENTMKICERVGAECNRLDPQVIVEGCEEL